MRRSHTFAFLLLASSFAGCGGDDGPPDTPPDAMDEPPPPPPPVCLDEAEEIGGDETNVFNADPALQLPYSGTLPSFQPGKGSPALTGGATPPARGGGFEVDATYYGAVDLDDWSYPRMRHPTGETPPDGNVVTTITGEGASPVFEITTDTVWSGTVRLEDGVDVVVSGGATLTVAGNTIVKGSAGSKIIVEPDGELVAVGLTLIDEVLVYSPIFFTSAAESPMGARGDWGGIVLLGNASVAGGTGTLDGRTFGGGATPDDAHRCGELSDVHIQYAETGLTLAGCGTGTVVDLTQVHLTSGDGVAVLGGTADLRRVVVTRAGDDGLAWDLGWTGTSQFLIAQIAGDHAIEGHGAGSAPVLYNTTLVGVGDGPLSDPRNTFGRRAAQLTDGTGVTMRNTIVLGFSEYTIDIAGDSADVFDEGGITIGHTMFAGNGVEPGFDSWPAGFDGTGEAQNDCR